MRKLIDLDTAIIAVEKESLVDGAYGYMDTKSIVDLLNNLPSAQPEPPEDICGECDAWNKYKSEHKTGRWIQCSERLPEDDVEVLITDDSGGVQWLAIDRMLSYEDVSGRFWLTSQNPTAWMPLPEPYRAERRIDDANVDT